MKLNILISVSVLGYHCFSLCSIPSKPLQSLLIPSIEIKFDDYTKKCSTSEFICTFDYFKGVIAAHQTPEFDALIDAVDLNSIRYKNEFQEKVIRILNTEILSKPQLAMLIKLINQINSLHLMPQLNQIESELKTIQSVLNPGIEITGENFIYLFKSMVLSKDLHKIKTLSLKIPLYILHFSSVPYKTNTFSVKEYQKTFSKSLLSDSCGINQLTYKVNSSKLCKHSNVPNKRPIRAESY